MITSSYRKADFPQIAFGHTRDDVVPDQTRCFLNYWSEWTIATQWRKSVLVAGFTCADGIRVMLCWRSTRRATLHERRITERSYAYSASRVCWTRQTE